MHPNGMHSCYSIFYPLFKKTNVFLLTHENVLFLEVFFSEDKSTGPVWFLVVKMHTSHQKHQGLPPTKNNSIHEYLLVYGATPLCSNFLGSVYTKRQRLSQRHSSDKNAIFLPRSVAPNVNSLMTLQNGVGCDPFLSISIDFNENRVASVIAEWSQR